ncbi:MAG TPA: hypothetical protein VFA78_08695 [Chloroflexota bacterium]|nr:hypothetical protein [Chloroflexota bacterium]
MEHKCVVVLEDDPDLAALVVELLSEHDYDVVVVTDPEELLATAARRHPCVALVDSTNPSHFDLWWVGPPLAAIGSPPIAFTAHSGAQAAFEADSHDFVGVIPKPFDADEFLRVVDTICWEDYQKAS